MRRLLGVALFVAVYLVTARFGLSLASVHPSATPVWPPTGIAIATALVLGPLAWLPIYASAFIVNLSTAGTWATSAGIAFGNLLEAVAGAYVIRRWAGGVRLLDRPANIFKFASSMPAVVAISATIGVTTLCTLGFAPWPQYTAIWLTWWLGDLTGALIFVPVVLAWAEPSPIRAAPGAFERCALYVVSIGVAAAAFLGMAPWPDHTPIAFLMIPPLVWAAFRFGQRDTTAVCALISTMATWGTVRGIGSFSVAGPNTSLLIAQGFVGTVTTLIVPMAAVVGEWRRAEAERSALLDREKDARRAAEASSSAKDDFLAMLSHELRNPLSAIAMASQVLGMPGAEKSALEKAREIIPRQVKNLARIMDDLLDLRRINTGQLTLERAPVDFTALVSHAVEVVTLSRRNGPPIAAVEVDLESREPLWVQGDATRLEQIVTNLMTNALKFTPAGGAVCVSLRRAGRWLELRVADTGIGIEAHLLPRIFDQFVQADPGPARSLGGLGLGLTIVKHLAAAHGGEVKVASDGTNRGAVFAVRLPRTDPPGDTAPAGVRLSARRRVLIVEDQDDARQMMRAALELAGHEVFEAADGPDGVRAAEQFRPNVAFVDIGLPGFDGVELARQVRARLGDQMVLVAVTGYGQPEDRRRTAEAGFAAHVVKPVDPATLAELAATV